MSVRAATPDDAAWIADFLTSRWGGVVSVSRGRVRDASALPAFVFGDAAGLATYAIEGAECELVTLDSLAPGGGTALLDAVAEAASAAGCRRLWLITTNDNVDALRFYQRRGLRLVAVHRDAMVESRALKPSIPLVGAHGIPITDEIELELVL